MGVYIVYMQWCKIQWEDTLYMYICIYICIYICKYVYIYTYVSIHSIQHIFTITNNKTAKTNKQTNIEMPERKARTAIFKLFPHTHQAQAGVVLLSAWLLHALQPPKEAPRVHTAVLGYFDM